MPTAAKSLAGLFTAEPLVAAAWDGRPVYKLAESVTESNDGKELIVTLRDGVRFHTGEPVTAATVRDLLVQKLKLVPEVAAIEAVGPRRLVFTLRRASSVKAEDLSALNVDGGDDADRVGLRTGPFKFVSSDPVVLESFDDYYQGRAAVQRVEIRDYANHRMAWTGMMRREVNFLHEVSRDAIEFVEAGGDIRAYPLLRPYYTALVFSMKHPLLRRRDVRVAINEAVDRNELLRNGMRGHGQIAEGPFWPYHWAYPQGRFPVSFNPEAARLRLDGAALRIRPATAQQMPSRFAFTCLIPDDARFERIGLLVQRQLYAVGIDMRLEPLPVGPLSKRLIAGDFDAFISELGSGRILSWAHRAWHTPAGTPMYPVTGYAAADEALDRLQVAHTDEEVREALSDVMHVLRSDPPAAFLVWPREARAADASLDIPYEPDHDIFGTLWQLKRAAPVVASRQ